MRAQIKAAPAAQVQTDPFLTLWKAQVRAAALDCASRMLSAGKGATAKQAALAKATAKKVFAAALAQIVGAVTSRTLGQLPNVTAEALAKLPDNNGLTPLHYAAHYGHLDQIPDLTAAGLAAPPDNNGDTPLHHAAQAGHLDQVPDRTAAALAAVRNKDGDTPLHDAAQAGHLDQVPDPTAAALAAVRNEDGETPLHDAAEHGHLDQVPDRTAAALAAVRNTNGYTPLHLAASCGHLDQVPDRTAAALAAVSNEYGDTPLHYAAEWGYLDQVPDLTAAALATVRNKDDETPLHYVAGSYDGLGQVEGVTVKLLNELDLLTKGLQPKNIGCLAAELSTNRELYEDKLIRTALGKAGLKLTQKSTPPAVRESCKRALQAANANGFKLSPKVLTALL